MRYTTVLALLTVLPVAFACARDDSAPARAALKAQLDEEWKYWMEHVTGPCQEVQDLARDAAVLIHEATTPQPFEGHTTPREAGQIAARAGAKRLALVHFSPRWTMSASQAIEEVRAGGFAGDAEIGREFGSYTL